MRTHLLIILLAGLFILPLQSQDSDYLKANYTKKEVYIPMRDGEKLYTAIYSPKDSSISYPILFSKTPYGIKPYGEDSFPAKIGPSRYLEEEKYIFVHQDARGMFLSTGFMDAMTPHIPDKKDENDIDNSSDTYDAVEWLLEHTNNNGSVGLWGISYRGFYASSGIIDAHPAIKCSSPQAPIADWYIGDDMHHHGAFALMPAYSFSEIVDQKHDTLFTAWPAPFDTPVRDAYNFYLKVGKLSDLNSRHFENKVPMWDTLVAHPNYDSYWQRRNILPHLKNIKPAVLVTAGLFDQENIFGSVQTYQAIHNNSENDTRIVLGPWIHGGWARTDGTHLGEVRFGSQTSDYYQKELELPFFNHYLKKKGLLDKHPKISVFTTGTNTWSFPDSWPPKDLQPYSLFLDEGASLSPIPPENSGFLSDNYISDPAHPVPYTQVFHPARMGYNKEFMSEDQRFAAARPDVLSYSTAVLDDTLIFQGPVTAKLYVSSTTTDLDLVVKVIDIYPDTIDPKYYSETELEMSGYYQLVRAEIFRLKYLNSYEKPEPILPGKIYEVEINLNDISHAFLPGHRVMVQIQSSMFPLYDRNPQTFMNIFEAKEDDFQKAGIQIYRSKDYPSAFHFGLKP